MSSLNPSKDGNQEVRLRSSLDSGEISHSLNSDSGSDSEDDNASLTGSAVAMQPPGATRKVLDNLQFSQFLRDHQENIYTSFPGSTIRDQDKSMHVLAQEAESEKIISSPREYQTELFERAKEKNIIAVLDTGAFSR